MSCEIRHNPCNQALRKGRARVKLLQFSKFRKRQDENQTVPMTDSAADQARQPCRKATIPAAPGARTQISDKNEPEQEALLMPDHEPSGEEWASLPFSQAALVKLISWLLVPASTAGLMRRCSSFVRNTSTRIVYELSGRITRGAKMRIECSSLRRQHGINERTFLRNLKERIML